MVTSPPFWAGRRVLVTGHTGFKGAWLSLWLAKLGAQVDGYALDPPSTPSLFELAGVARQLHSSSHGDINDGALLDEHVRQLRPQVVFHLAAQSLVRRSYEFPVETFATNVLGTVHILEAVRRAAIPCVVVIVTSDKCYDNREWDWPYRENDPLGGYDPYSSSKGCAELVTAAYRRSYFSAPLPAGGSVAVASARAGNVIGGGDWARDRLVPDFVRAAEVCKPAVIRNPHALRPWQHVLEPLAGYLLLAEALAERPGDFARAWNFAASDDQARPVSWLADTMVRLWQGQASWVVDAKPQPHEAHALRLDASLARSLLGWRPRLHLETALEWVVEWYQRCRGGEDAARVTLDQIGRYERLAKPS
ncbi:MAG TPA: CDP-glucose 4,6-dehydratase [bacterium]|nr:CDP-glucose 4,6-dehydratase [bacterium]